MTTGPGQPESEMGKLVIAPEPHPSHPYPPGVTAIRCCGTCKHFIGAAKLSRDGGDASEAVCCLLGQCELDPPVGDRWYNRHAFQICDEYEPEF